jgi:hypothetical protein
MRTLLLSTAVAALSGAAMLAVAADADMAAPEARAYATLSFGGAPSTNQRSFHYGLRLDYQDGPARSARPPVMDWRFDRSGLVDTRLNGLNVVRRLALNQDESYGDYGSGSGEATTTYSVIDWTLVAVGVVGIGFVAAEALDTEETADPSPPDDNGGGGLTDLPIDPILDLVLDTVLGFKGDGGMLPTHESYRDIQQQRWLDSGTGQMGDLGG